VIVHNREEAQRWQQRAETGAESSSPE
jgi:hypothetical protein